MAAYFNKVNAHGGVNGRKIKYTALDDGYDPSRVASNAHKLVQQNGVFAFVGFGGTNLTIRNYMKSRGVPQFVMAGNVPLSNIKKYPTTRAWWPDISLEGALTAKAVLKANPKARIGTLGLDNDITASQVKGIKKGLAGQAGKLVDQETFAPTATDYSSQISRLKSSHVNTLVSGMNGPGGISALKYMRQIGYKPQIYNYSVSSNIATLTGKAGDAATGVHSVQWLKDPADPQWADDKGIQQYKKAIKSYGHGAKADDQIVLNGYGFGEAFVKVLKGMKNPTRKGLIKAWDNVKDQSNGALLTGINLSAGPDGRLIHSYRLTTWTGETWKIEGGVLDAYKLGLLSHK
jgi:branched-chain amino acid transport system substrate-binding protein